MDRSFILSSCEDNFEGFSAEDFEKSKFSTERKSQVVFENELDVSLSDSGDYNSEDSDDTKKESEFVLEWSENLKTAVSFSNFCEGTGPNHNLAKERKP